MSESTTSPQLSPSYWIIVSGIDNFRTSRDLGFSVQGMKSRHRKKAERMTAGDKIIYYVTGLKTFGGITTITGPYFESHEKIWESKNPKKGEEDYPFRVPIEQDVILDEEEFVPAEPLARQMEYTKRWPEANWTLAFQGNVHHIGINDYQIVRAAILGQSDTVEAADH